MSSLDKRHAQFDLPNSIPSPTSTASSEHARTVLSPPLGIPSDMEDVAPALWGLWARVVLRVRYSHPLLPLGGRVCPPLPSRAQVPTQL